MSADDAGGLAGEGLGELRARLAPARGVVRNARFGYGGELRIEVDDPRAPGGPPWRIGSQGSPWRIEGGRGAPLRSDAQDRVRGIASELSGAAVAGFEVGDVTACLVIRFGDGRRLTVEASADSPHDAPEAPPFWEVFTPEGQVLSAGPGDRWRACDSGTPVSEIG